MKQHPLKPGVLVSLMLAIGKGAVFAQSAALPKGVERVTSVEGITEYRLPNGSCPSNLRLIRQPDRPGKIPSLLYLYEGLLP
jgi:hypothetical protein